MQALQFFCVIFFTKLLLVPATFSFSNLNWPKIGEHLKNKILFPEDVIPRPYFNFDPRPQNRFGQRPHKNQEVEHPKGQEPEDFHFGSKPKKPKGQKVEEINFGSKPEEPRGQEPEDFKFGPKPEKVKGQEVEEINFSHPKGQEPEEFTFGSKPKQPKGQEVEEINFGPKPEHPKGQEVEEINFGPKTDKPKGQEIEEINFGPKTDKPKGQEIEEINFGPKTDKPKGQEIEEINFGPKTDKPKGQEIEEINFGPKPEHPKGQEVEEINFGPKPEHPKGQEVEEISFGPKTDKPKGQEIEEINFGPKPEHPKGQEVEEINFGPKPEKPKGQEIEEINFGPKPEHPKGQEVEEINFGPKPEHPKGQEVEEINFGPKPDHPKGQEVEEINFGPKPDHPKGQEVEEINFGPKPDHPKGQEVEEINFGPKPDHPKGQEVEEINFGPKPKNPKGQEIEEINFGPKPEKPKGQQVEEINFGSRPKKPKKEDFYFVSNPKQPKGQEIESLNFEGKPEEPKGQVEENINGKPNGPLEPDEGGNWFDIFLPAPVNEEGCKDIPEVPVNTKINCASERKCEITCHEGYQFPENKEKLFFECHDRKWIMQEAIKPECHPVCVPPCQNEGVCIGPNQCECPKNFEGAQCQFGEKPCMHHPPVSQNSQVHCNASNCVVECFHTYSFPDGSSVANLVCHQGKWTVDRADWNSLPDCKPSCNPPCINGGTCLDYNKCQCPRQYAGPQCQYELAVCDGQKLNFNGFYSCKGESDKVTCTLSCPEDYKTDVPIVSEYVCHYSTGVFEPEPIPKCIYEKNTEVIKTASSTHTINGGGFEDFESHKVPPPIERKPGECVTWKGYHFKNFDGQVYSFTGDCSYILAQDTENTFQVLIQNPECQTGCTRVVRVFYQNKEYKLMYKDGIPTLAVNDVPHNVPIQLFDFSVQQKETEMLVYLQGCDVNLILDKNDRISVGVSANMWNKTSGLCGNLNNDPSDDFKTPEGSSAWASELFVRSWASDAYNCETSPEVYNLCTDESAYDYCHKVLTDPHFEICYNSHKFISYKEACAWDYCKCGQSCACATVREFVTNCKNYLISEGYPDSTSNWRQIATCPWECPPGKIYSSCGPSLEPSCKSVKAEKQIVKYSQCVEGCFCPEGTFLLNDTCVPLENCPCYWRNKAYGSGEQIAKQCNTCTCQNGEWVCTNLKCESRCSVTGDSHYLTFDGRRYDFMGHCSYYLLKSHNYSVESENVACSRDAADFSEIFSSDTSEYSSCRKSITIRSDKDVIQLKKHKEVVVNGVQVSEFPAVVNGVVIRLASSIHIRVTMPDLTDIWWDGNTNVYVDAHGNNENIIGGLCGTFNDNQKDDFITPEGDVEQSTIAFAEKWKTDETCKEYLDPLKPHPCDSNIKNKGLAEKYCQKLKQKAFQECLPSVDVEPFYKNCLYDVCSCQKDIMSCFCPILADYGNECGRQNMDVSWRNEIRECGLHCPTGQIYQSCGDSCSRTCRDLSLSNDHRCNKKCVEGCSCPEGLTLNDAGHCIPISTCPCIHQNVKYKPSQEIIKETDNGPQFCVCENAAWSCRPATKLEIARDYENSNVKCNESMHEEYTNCEPAEPKTCKNMHEKSHSTTRICFPGCVCKKGYVWDSIGKICVNASECPCHHGGRSYGDGEKIQEDCNTCLCTNGKWSCTKRDCAAICSTWGDSHFKTFDGKIYEFQGSCEFVLVAGSISEYDTFAINLQIVPCGSTGISCPKSVSLKVGSRHKEEEVVFRKSNPSSIPRDLERIIVREAGLFVFAEVFDLGITVQWDKGTRVYVKADPKWKNRVKGLCGNFNDNELDDFKTPSSGETSEISPVVFADSWRLQSYCPESYPITDTCERRPHRRAWAVEKCSILKSETFEPCHSEVPFESHLERCIVDTCGCDEGGDCECLCTAIAAYAEECTLRGVPVKWRTQELCGLQCENGSHYNPCVSTCPPKSCDNQFKHTTLLQTCSEESCVEGCEKTPCPPDHVLADSSSNKCVPITSCKTVCLTVNNVTYLEGDLMESDDCHSCFCSHHDKKCTGQPCSPTHEPSTSLATELTTIRPSTTSSVCPPGQIWDDCIVKCEDTCNYLEAKLKMMSQCLEPEDCVSGCKPIDLNCPPDMYLRDENTCVQKKDCPCLSYSMSIAKPGDVIHESECEKCQCIDNEYECTFVCTSPSYTTHPSALYTKKRHTVTPGMDFGHEGNVTLIIRTTAPTHPTLFCPSEQYESLIDDFCKFSASSYSDEFSTPQNGRIDSKGWTPAFDNPDQYLQVDLGKVVPVFAVNVAGASGKYVTGYHILYSLNGHKYVDIINADGKKEVFGGPFDGHHSVKQVLPVPIEARYIRFHPSTWHKGISMKVDVLGCKEEVVSTTPYPTTPVPSICNKPIGIGQKYFPKLKITVTSSKPHTGPDFIGFDNERGWQPLTNSKSEWVQLDFGEYVNFTGIITKGVSQSNDLSAPTITDSWVERYKVEYSNDDLSWNPILDDFGNEMVFMGNTDSDSEKKNFFKRPIHATALRIIPIKWHENIGLRLDVMGCYQPSRLEVEVTPPTIIPKFDCNVCKGALDDEKCKCTGDEWWDGEKCVVHSECPCFVGLIAYPVGTTFTTEKCEECVCRLFGIPHCSPKVCEDCPPGLQKVVTPLCGCTCKPCEDNTRLCPTSNICLEESAWCNGVQDCPDDETNCSTPVPTVPSTPKPCKPSCPPGYDVVFRNKTAGPSEAEHMMQKPTRVKSIKSKKSVKTYKGSKKSRKYGKPEKLTECPPYDCVPAEEVPIDCPPPECPLDYSVIYKKTVEDLHGVCPLYTCEPKIKYDNCTVSSRNIETFDGTEYKYDICDHVLARHDLGLWNVTMFKTCSYISPCVSGLLIHQNGHVIEIHPHNRTIMFDSFPYTYSQVEMLNSKIMDLTINPIGDSIIFLSEIYGFAVIYEGNENVRIMVPNQMKGHLNGLCGLYNGHPNDDKTLPDGKLSKTTVDFGDSWFNPGGKECIESACPIDMQKAALEICLILKNEPFSNCLNPVNMENCIEKTCNCLSSNKTEDDCRCLTLSDFASKCKKPVLFGWRVDHDCPVTCPPNLVHYDCYPYACEPTCGNEECSEPATDCYSGCFCPDGLVKRGDQCIKLQECRDCVCSGMGDSTYLTFDGGLTFNGNCTYIATREKSSTGTPDFEILITNGLCNGSDFMTCTEKMEIKVAGHSIKLVAIPDSADKVLILLDGYAQSREDLSNLKEPWGKIELNTETSSVKVDLPKDHVEVRFFYRRFAFTISLPSKYYKDRVEGLCGSCSRNDTSEESGDPEDWQTESDGSCLIDPPTECLPTAGHEEICNFFNDAKVFGQCLNFIDPKPFIDQCLASLCDNGHVCNSLEAYTQACRDLGICVTWRTDEFCPFTCSADLEYHSCKSGCFKTCENFEDITSTCSAPPVEGCFCPENHILINGTCQPEKYCKYCDEGGRHYEDETWAVDQCTNCTCKNRLVTCNTVECPAVEIICDDKDEILIKEKTESECCPKYKCGCKPKEECPKVELPNEVLPVGMEAVINETECCPRVEIVCRKENCPEPKPCRNHYIQKVVNVTDCCPQHVCEKPENICIYEYGQETSNEHDKREKREPHEEVAKEVGDRWMDGPCKSCVCVLRNGIAEAVCMQTECTQLEEHHDYKEYELDYVYNPEKCCPEVVRKACKDNGIIYQVGDFWMPDDNNPCETMKCNRVNGQPLKETRMEICNKECDPGWQYKESEGECCGHCVQIGCLIGDKIYKEGESWPSEDGCSNSTCDRKNENFVISTMTESCPSVEDCPEEDIYKDKCCMKCKIRPEDKKICTPQPLPLESTVKIIQEKKGKHGLCQNLHPIHNFTQCAGNCDSYTVYNPETSSHDSVCKCCRPQEYSLLTVELKCEDGLEVMKSLTVPFVCSCMPCGG